MSFAWQNAIVLGLVALAVLYVIRQAWRVITKRQIGCGSKCNSCPSNEVPAAGQRQPFVDADELASTYRPRDPS